MYCKNCGKEISEGALFCTNCGQKAVIPTFPAMPNESTESVPASAQTAFTEATNTQNGSESLPISNPEEQSAVPRPVERSYYGSSQAQSTENPASISSTPAPASIEFRPESKPVQKEERHFTWTHIWLCLGAVAIMAIVAGVFAGLYFSLL